MALQVMHDNDILITSQQDANLYFGLGNNQKHYINKGIGNNFEVVTSGLQATLKKGQGAIYGRHVTNDADVSITLPANSSFYLVLRFDKNQSKGNEIEFKAVTVLQENDLSNGGYAYDLPLYRVVTTTSNATKTDLRVYKELTNISLASVGCGDTSKTFSDFCNELKRIMPTNTLLIDTVTDSYYRNLANILRNETKSYSDTFMIEFVTSSTRSHGSKITVRDSEKNEYMCVIDSGTKWVLTPIFKDTGWIELLFNSGYLGYATSSNGTPAYRVVNNQVEFRGIVQRTTTTAGVIAAIPVKYAPTKTKINAAVKNDGSIVPLYMQATGELQILVTGAITWFNLADLRYTLE